MDFFLEKASYRNRFSRTTPQYREIPVKKDGAAGADAARARSRFYRSQHRPNTPAAFFAEAACFPEPAAPSAVHTYFIALNGQTQYAAGESAFFRQHLYPESLQW
jgi:hypothetical protein